MAEKLHPNEDLKTKSNFLRGTIVEDLNNPVTGSFKEENTQLTKFHGFYQQDDRDLRSERKKQKLEPLYSMMIRVRMPGGVCTPDQWLKLDQLADLYGQGSIRLTTRQTIQYHHILKNTLKETMKGINSILLDTIAACGDVNRNVMCNPNPYQSAVHEEVYRFSKKLSEHLLPKTRAYHEIWMDGEKVYGADDKEPIYGPTYLPRKFKAGVAVPPSNDIDIFSQDLGFIAILDKKENLLGYNVTVGGGMGMTHGKPETYPRVADVMGYIKPEDALAVAEAVLTTQRDWGDREERKHARLKYTIDDHGLEKFRAEVEKRSGVKLEEPAAFEFTENGDRYGWVKGVGDMWHYTLFIQSGRIRDREGYPIKTALKEIARIHQGDFRCSSNQNMLITNVHESQKKRIDKILEDHNLQKSNYQSGLKLSSMACVAFPTCGLAMAESERYMPDLLAKLDNILEGLKLKDEKIIIRMTGCPNGCARPYLAEIAFVGKGPGKYNFYLGGGFSGERLNKLYMENVDEETILRELDGIFRDFAKTRKKKEHFGDFVIRKGYVKETLKGKDFHD